MTRRQQVLDALAHLGPSTAHRISRHLGVDVVTWVTSIASRMTRSSPRCAQQIHVTAWSSNSVHDKRDYPRAVYALGPGVNVPKPQTDRNLRARAANARCRKRANLWRMSSPFNMGVSAHAARYSENRK